MGTRPAKPGDIGILIRDDFADGRNVGKEVHVDKQCSCYGDRWRCTARELIKDGNDIFDQLFYMLPPDVVPGCAVCPKKTSVIVREDPDEIPTEIVRELTTT